MEDKQFVKVRIRHYRSTCDRVDKSLQGRLMNVSPIHRVFAGNWPLLLQSFPDLSS